jgi:hypothetical protein
MLAAVLMVLATPALAGPGADFCIALQDQSVACINENEAVAKATNVQPTTSCPKALAGLKARYNSASTVSEGALKGELDKSHTAFLASTRDIAPRRGETQAEYLGLIENLEGAMLAACVRLRTVDTAY